MATFNYLPDWGAAKKKKPRVNTLQFGDGYEQRSADGINTSPQEWAGLVFKRDVDTAAAIDTFLEARNGTEAFNWTTPNGDSIVVKCEEWETKYDDAGWSTVTATFKQVFEVVAA